VDVGSFTNGRDVGVGIDYTGFETKHVILLVH